MQEYIKTLYGVEPTERMFPITKYYLHHEMDRGSKQAGVKRIRIHALMAFFELIKRDSLMSRLANTQIPKFAM